MPVKSKPVATNLPEDSFFWAFGVFALIVLGIGAFLVGAWLFIHAASQQEARERLVLVQPNMTLDEGIKCDFSQGFEVHLNSYINEDGRNPENQYIHCYLPKTK
jgi:hypothetical protein